MLLWRERPAITPTPPHPTQSSPTPLVWFSQSAFPKWRLQPTGHHSSPARHFEKVDCGFPSPNFRFHRRREGGQGGRESLSEIIWTSIYCQWPPWGSTEGSWGPESLSGILWIHTSCRSTVTPTLLYGDGVTGHDVTQELAWPLAHGRHGQINKHINWCNDLLIDSTTCFIRFIHGLNIYIDWSMLWRAQPRVPRSLEAEMC